MDLLIHGIDMTHKIYYVIRFDFKNHYVIVKFLFRMLSCLSNLIYSQQLIVDFHNSNSFDINYGV